MATAKEPELTRQENAGRRVADRDNLSTADFSESSERSRCSDDALRALLLLLFFI